MAAPRRKALLKVIILGDSGYSPPSFTQPLNVQRRQDLTDEPIRTPAPVPPTLMAGEQEVQHPIQSNHRRRFPHKRDHRRRQSRHHAGTGGPPNTPPQPRPFVDCT
jgi:hypothetical protein